MTSPIRRLLAIAQTGLVAATLHPQRSVVTTAAVLAILLPYTCGLGISYGIQQQAEDSIRFGADLYVSASLFGRSGPVPLTALEPTRQVEGVLSVVPRIVGAIVLGKDRHPAVLVGIPPEQLPQSIHCIEGRLFKSDVPNELVIGRQLARRMALKPGAMIPPFYHSRKGDRVSTVVGVFQADVPIWEANLIFTSLETAWSIFDQEGWVTDLLVYCRPGYDEVVRESIRRNVRFGADESDASSRLRIVAQNDLRQLLPAGLLRRQGLFNLHFVLAFAVGIPIILVTSGLGLSERRREIGILKATGWQTDEVLLRSLVESLLVSLAGAALAVLLAYLWLKGLNGYGVASVFLVNVDLAPSFRVPFRLTPIPVLLCFVISFALVMTGTLYSTWRGAIAPPIEAMR